MNEELEKLLETGKILLDNSFTDSDIGENIPSLLYDNKWYEVTEESLSLKLERITYLENLIFRNYDLCAIPETKSEIEEYLRLLNGHKTYFGKPKEKSYKGNNGKAFQKRMNKCNKRSEWANENEEEFSSFCRLTDRLYNFLKRLPVLKMTAEEENSRYYRRVAGLVDCVHAICVKKGENLGFVNREEHKNPVRIGEKLKTDQKIIVSSIIEAFYQPVLILTNDKGILMSLQRFYNEVARINAREPHNPIIVPTHSISIYGPSFRQEDGSFAKRLISFPKSF